MTPLDASPALAPALSPSSPGITPSPGLTAFLQPIVTLPGRQMVGHEALLRLPRPDGGFDLPARFLQQINQLHRLPCTQLHADILAVMLQTARRIVRTQGTWVAINVPRELWDASHVIARLCQQSGQGITLEILEDRPLNLSSLRRAVARVRAAGYRVALDDFGAGYGNGACLHELGTVDYVKTDRSFAADEAGRSMLPALCAMGHSRGAAVIVEGIENEAAHRAAVVAGADMAQGFLYGVPHPA